METPFFLMDDLGGKTPIFENTHILGTMSQWSDSHPKDVARDLVKRILRHLDHLRDTQNEEIYGHACAYQFLKGWSEKTVFFLGWRMCALSLGPLGLQLNSIDELVEAKGWTVLEIVSL